MKLSPIDIQQQQFRRVMRGYCISEVHRFLEVVSEQMMDLVRQNTQLTNELALMTQQRDQLKSHEEELKSVMLQAQRTVDEMRGQAEKEAALIQHDAELRAEKILLNAQNKVDSISEECQDLRRERIRFEEELRGLINTYARLLDMRNTDNNPSLPASQTTVTVLDCLRPPAPPQSEETPFAQPS